MSPFWKMSAIFGSVVVGLGLFIAATMGPVGIQNKFTAWKASAYGSDWLIVQYTATGDVLHSWELKNAAVHSEAHSDGIYFTTDRGVVHLSGNYIYVQSPNEETKKQFLVTKDRAIQPSVIPAAK